MNRVLQRIRRRRSYGDMETWLVIEIDKEIRRW
jgi:hypothetical protein